MEFETIRSVLGWCAVINIGILIWWSVYLLCFPNWLYRMSCKWVEISEPHFKSIHFALLGWFKLSVILFNIAPYFALLIVI